MSFSAQRQDGPFALGMSYYPLGDAGQRRSLRRGARGAAAWCSRATASRRPDRTTTTTPAWTCSGKAVLIFSHEPQERRANSRLNGTRPLPQTTLEAKAAAARDRGARAADRDRRSDARDRSGQLRLVRDGPGREDQRHPGAPRASQGDAAAARRLGPRPRARRIDAIWCRGRGRLTGATVGLHGAPGQEPPDGAQRRRRAAGQRRLCGDEAIVHRRALRPRRARRPPVGHARSATGEIHNGADDNASGTSAIIEMARVAAADQRRFPRSLVFIAFAGEERGLLGSAHYTDAAADPDRRHLGDVESRHGGPRARQRGCQRPRGRRRSMEPTSRRRRRRPAASRSAARVRAQAAATTRRSSTGACRRSISSLASTATITARRTTGSASTLPGTRAWPRSRWSWRRVSRRATPSLNSPAVADLGAR